MYARASRPLRGRGREATLPPMKPRPPRSPRALPALLLVVTAALPGPATAQVELCVEAERFVRDLGMEALTEPDTIDDWRTGLVTPGCRVTAAGATAESTGIVARGFFQALADSEWHRTPDPRDSPNEASLRYRRFDADCLFSYYDGSLSLGTEAEFAVMDAVDLRPGEGLYHLLVRCVPAAPAAPRDGG